MKPATLPAFCGAALAMMSAASLSHWCSVNEFVTAIHAGLPVQLAPSPSPTAPPVLTAPDVEMPTSAPTTLLVAHQSLTPPAALGAAAGDPSQQKFYEALVSRMESIQSQNRDLLSQVAETNRDMMNLNFRVDTFSESFRPMPVGEPLAELSYLDGPGVLPPRAEPIDLPTFDE